MPGNGLGSVEAGEEGEASIKGVMVSGDLKVDAGTTGAISEVMSEATKEGVLRRDVLHSKSKEALVEASGTLTSGRKTVGPGCLVAVVSREITTEEDGTKEEESREDVSRTGEGS